MTLPIQLPDLEVRSRQTVFVWEDAFRDGLERYDFTDHVAKMQVRLYPGAPGAPLLDLATVLEAGEGIRFVSTAGDAVLDRMRIVFAEASVKGLPGLHTPEIGDPQVFHHDVLITAPGKPEQPWFFGRVIVFPGVTA